MPPAFARRDHYERILGKTSELLHKPLPGPFNFAWYNDIHRYPFCDLYPWAGQVRNIDLSKAPCLYLPRKSNALPRYGFDRLVNTDPRAISTHKCATTVAVFNNTTNLLRSSRGGNGHTLLVFFQQWLQVFDHELDFSQANIDLMMMATIHAAQGVMEHLVAFFKEQIK